MTKFVNRSKESCSVEILSTLSAMGEKATSVSERIRLLNLLNEFTSLCNKDTPTPADLARISYIGQVAGVNTGVWMGGRRGRGRGRGRKTKKNKARTTRKNRV